MGDNPLFPVSLAINSYMPGLSPQDKNGRAGSPARWRSYINRFLLAPRQQPIGRTIGRIRMKFFVAAADPCWLILNIIYVYKETELFVEY